MPTFLTLVPKYVEEEQIPELLRCWRTHGSRNLDELLDKVGRANQHDERLRHTKETS
jgi:hypothetical protein